MPEVTIYDVARLAGVSISTVSLVTNKPDRVADSTRRRVLAAIDELAYVPKEQAVARARRGVGQIGVLAPFNAHPSFATMLSGVLEEASHQAVQVAVFDHPSAARTARFLETLPASRRLDGLIVMAIPLEPSVATRLRDGSMPAVLTNVVEPGFTSICTDDEAGGEAVGRALAERGHTRVGFLRERQAAPGFDSQSLARLRGLRCGLATVGDGSAPDEFCPAVDGSAESAYEVATALLSRPDRPTAVFAHCDLYAAATLRAARDLALAVPSDVAVVGYDDLDWAEAIGLTTVRQPLRENGRLAARAVLDQIDGVAAPGARTTLPVSLVLRDTL
ncbi:LacI family DNA-binding transcriptional regulator [Cellulomonas sp. NPDC089187]|uniref:LacI family DNA-binding transcriptional regulator n=1 Tax=Cellulomonas sp. NPDC089187 TaxID=3154970 RepID=UPI00342D302B